MNEIKQNLWYHNVGIPIMNSLLWLVALLLSCYSGWIANIDEENHKICVFLIIYCTFMLEGALIWWDIIAVHYNKAVKLKDFGFIRTIFFNMALTLILVVIFFVSHTAWLIYTICLTATWLKYIVCRISPSIEESNVPYIANEYNVRKI